MTRKDQRRIITEMVTGLRNRASIRLELPCTIPATGQLIVSCRELFICDICGAERGETTDWFEVVPDLNGDGLPMLILEPFSGRLGQEHICSSACLGKRVQQFEKELRKKRRTQEAR